MISTVWRSLGECGTAHTVPRLSRACSAFQLAGLPGSCQKSTLGGPWWSATPLLSERAEHARVDFVLDPSGQRVKLSRCYCSAEQTGSGARGWGGEGRTSSEAARLLRHARHTREALHQLRAAQHAGHGARPASVRTNRRTHDEEARRVLLVALSSPRSTAVRVLLLVCSPSELQVHLLTRHHALVSAAVMERKSLPAVVIKKSPFQARWFRALDCLSTLRRSRSRRFTRRLRRRRRRRVRPRYGASLAPDTRGLATEAG